MDNDLLSKSKLIDWLEEKIESYFLAYHNSCSDYDQGREASYHEVIESVRSGLFDPDPTPKYRVVLYNLKNGLEKLESEIIDKRPSDEEAEMGRILYGAERFEIVEVRE